MGDVALASLLRFHGATMNGGVLHAIECLSDDALAAAESGYRFFGFDEVTNLIDRAIVVLSQADAGEYERELNKRYAFLIPRDSVIVERFEAHLERNVLDFAPVQ